MLKHARSLAESEILIISGFFRMLVSAFAMVSESRMFYAIDLVFAALF